MPAVFLREHWEAHRSGNRLVYGGREFRTFSACEGLRSSADVLAATPAENDLEMHRGWLATDRPWMSCVGTNLSIRRSSCLLFDEAFEGWGSEDRDFAYRVWASGVKAEVLARTGLTQVLGTDTERWNPLTGGHKALVATLKAKVHLARKYPGELMAPSLDPVRRCHLDRVTNTWRLGPSREGVAAAAILDEFAVWLEAQSATE